MKYSLKLFQLILVGMMCVSFSGCWFLVIGGAGAVGGYAVSQDTFEGISSKGQEELITAAHKVLAIMGSITDERPKDGEIVATVNGATVHITVIQLNLTTSKLRVKARKDMFPCRSVAQEVYTKIMNQLE